MTIKISRRKFLRIAMIGTGSAVLTGCKWPRRWEVLEPYVVPPEEQVAGKATWYASTCRQCPAGCGIIVRIMNGRAVKIEGNPQHPLNQGKLCARGQSGLQLLYNPDRLQGPQQQTSRGSKTYTDVSWDDGVKMLADKLQAAGPDVAVWAGSTVSGHVYDLFSRLTTAIGAPAPLVYDLYTLFNGYANYGLADQALYSTPQLPAYQLGDEDVIFSFGANFTGAWHSGVRYGIEFGKFRSQPLGKRGFLVQIEPRMSSIGSKADRWVPAKPGSELTLAKAIISQIAGLGVGSNDVVTRARAMDLSVDLQQAAQECDLQAAEIQDLARIFGSAQKALAIPGELLANQPNAAEVITAVQALNVVSGADTRSSALVGSAGLQQPALQKPAVSTYADAQKLIQRMSSGQVKVLVIYGANPAYDLPQQAGFLDALKNVPFVVSFAPVIDETAVQADLILPDRTYLESWGYDVTSPDFGTPSLSSQQPVVMPVYDIRSAGDVILDAAKEIPAAASVLTWKDEVEFLKEQIGGLPIDSTYGTTPGAVWASFLQKGGWWPQSAGAAASNHPPATVTFPTGGSQYNYQGDAQTYPYYLHLYLSELLSDGRGANQPWLQGSPDVNTSISWQTWVEINPTTAGKMGVQQGDILKITSPAGEIEAAAYLYPAIRPDTVAMPLGQGHTDFGRYASRRGVNAVQLAAPQSGSGSVELPLGNIRVQVTPTGRKMHMATFEYTEGVETGFLNKGFPGE